jgi:hypothetical protein
MNEDLNNKGGLKRGFCDCNERVEICMYGNELFNFGFMAFATSIDSFRAYI